ncbi:hypothetical protein VA7868_02930 [Vibrio aerogenes CECT 7868]|uniref:N-acetyltransferase domain-containing protein n=1 Tax=Vibrio aerogenes CECT 7868 TaxID=1216006 RepID=A0A1M5ZMC3_9VIBR|nr:hypothetical protein VA7868_02930 [Vibrio aerogenes CECT 7868]
MVGDEKMKFTLIRPGRADINTQFSLIRPAFNGVPAAKYEYQFCRESVMNLGASFYQLKGHGASVRFIGYVTGDNEYLILAMTGKGLKQAAPHIIEAVRSQGYRSIKYHTVRPGMTRLLRSFGFKVIKTSGAESVLSLNLYKSNRQEAIRAGYGLTRNAETGFARPVYHRPQMMPVMFMNTGGL